MLMRFAHRPRACFLCFEKKLSPNFPNSRNPPGGGNDVGFAALMEADIDLGFTALKAAAAREASTATGLADRKSNSTATSPDCF